MPPQDCIMKILWLCLALLAVAYFGTSDAVSLKRNAIKNPAQQEVIPDFQDGLTRELGALPNAAGGPMKRNGKSLPANVISEPKVGFDKAAMLFMKRYVDALSKRSYNSHNTPQKKSIYGPGMYPFYGMYGKRALEDPRFGYTQEVMDMIRALVDRTEKAAALKQKQEEMAKAEEHTMEEESKGTKENIENNIKSEELKDLQPANAKATNMGSNEDKEAKVSAYEEDADEKALESVEDLVARH